MEKPDLTDLCPLLLLCWLGSLVSEVFDGVVMCDDGNVASNVAGKVARCCQPCSTRPRFLHFSPLWVTLVDEFCAVGIGHETPQSL